LKAVHAVCTDSSRYVSIEPDRLDKGGNRFVVPLSAKKSLVHCQNSSLHHTAITYGALGGWFYHELPPSATLSSEILTLFCTTN
jgi:hypothetical protein